jgi:hypothetical protein
MAVSGEQCDQDDQGAGQQSGDAGTIQQGKSLCWIEIHWFCHDRSEHKPEPIGQ